MDAVTIPNPETAIKEHFFDKRVRWAKGVLSLVGLALSAFMYMAEVAERRRREQRDGADRARLEEQLAEARAELSNLKDQQAPSAVLDALKEELEWQERRGGPKSPFRRQ